MMMKKLIYPFACIITLLVFNSCKHDNFEDFVGPALCPTESFAVTEPFRLSSSNINFNTYPGLYGDSIKAKFSEEVTWTVSLKGNTSGATKSYKGRSAEIDTIWYGQSSSAEVFFQTGEEVTVTLSLNCLGETDVKTVTIVDASRFKTNVGPFTMVSDFDGSGYVANSVTLAGYNASGWSSYFTAPNDISTFKIGPDVSTLTAAQGSNYLTIQGTAAPSSWFVGGFYVNAPTSFPGTNADQIYLNAFISSGDNTTTTLGLTMVAGSTKYNYVLPINWTGWKMVAIKLSDFKTSSGTPLSNVSALTAIDMGLNCASKQGQSTEVDLDFVVFSNNGPFFQ